MRSRDYGCLLPVDITANDQTSHLGSFNTLYICRRASTAQSVLGLSHAIPRLQAADRVRLAYSESYLVMVDITLFVRRLSKPKPQICNWAANRRCLTSCSEEDLEGDHNAYRNASEC